MALYQSKNATGKAPVPSIQSSLISGMLFNYLTTAALATGDIIDLGPIAPGVTPVDVTLVSDDLDSNGAPAITLSVGILNAAKTDMGAGANDTWITASTVAQAGGVARATTPNCALCGPATTERRLGVKVVAGAATGVVGKQIQVQLKAVG